MRKLFVAVPSVALLALLTMAQVSGPTTRTPRLTVGPGDLTILSGSRIETGTIGATDGTMTVDSDVSIQSGSRIETGTIGATDGTMTVDSDVSIAGGGEANGDLSVAGDLTVTGTCTGCGGGGSSGTYSETFLGCTTTPSLTVEYFVSGDIVTLYMAPSTTNCTSNATTFQISATNIPAALVPGTTVRAIGIAPCLLDNGTRQTDVGAVINGSGFILFGVSGSVTGWTASGTKGFDNSGTLCSGDIALSYPIRP